MTAVAVAAAAGERRALPGAFLVSAATALSGVLTYAFLVLAARALGPAAYGRVGVLWAAMFIAAIVLFRPLEQTASQAIAARSARGASSTAVVSSVVKAALALTALLVIASLAAWPLLRDRLFDGSSLLAALLPVGIVLYGCSYVVRGVVGGVRWFPGYGLALVADSLGRLLIALPLVLVSSTVVAAVAVVVAGGAGAIAPLVTGRARLVRSVAAGTASDYRLSSAAAFALPAAVVAACDQIVINGPPLVVALDGASSATVGVVFAATMLVRAPVYVFQGLAASLLPNFTHLGRVAMRRHVLRLASALAGVGAVVAVGAAVAGPQVMSVLYGDRYSASRGDLALLGVAVGGYLVAATLSQALLAAERPWIAARIWVAAAASFLVAFVLVPGGALDRVAGALAVATVAAAVALGAEIRRR